MGFEIILYSAIQVLLLSLFHWDKNLISFKIIMLCLLKLKQYYLLKIKATFKIIYLPFFFASFSLYSSIFSFRKVKECAEDSIQILIIIKFFHFLYRVKLIFITADQQEIQIEARVGMTVMEAAVKNKIPMEGKL